jgi:hypothetical protein
MESRGNPSKGDVSTPRRHHFVPQSYLANFTSTGTAKGRLRIVDLETGRRFNTTPAKFGHERDFYRMDEADAPNPLAAEELFGIYESAGTRVVRAVVAAGELPSRGHEDFSILMTYVAMLAQRDPQTRARLIAFVKGIVTQVASSMTITQEDFDAVKKELHADGTELDPAVDLTMVQNLQVGRDVEVVPSNTWFLQAVAQAIEILTPILGSRRWQLLLAEEGEEFLVSGRPVTLSWIEPPGPGFHPIAFGMPGTEVFLPLARRAGLLGRFEDDLSSVTAQIDRSSVAAHNGRSIRQAVRFVCWAEGAASVPCRKGDQVLHVEDADFPIGRAAT